MLESMGWRHIPTFSCVMELAYMEYNIFKQQAVGDKLKRTSSNNLHLITDCLLLTAQLITRRDTS
jgi:hypothetical protein